METYKAAELARTLMNENGLRDWLFEFDRAARRFGACYYGRKKISLSEKLTVLNSEAAVRETLLHEIAHALTPNDRGHGKEWARACWKLGIPANRCFDSSVETPKGQWRATCIVCGKEHTMHRRPKNRRSCRCLGKAFNPATVLEFRRWVKKVVDPCEALFADWEN